MKKSMKKVFAGLMIATIGLTGFGCGEKAQQEESSQTSSPSNEAVQTVTDGKFTIAMECGYPPFNWTQTTDVNGAVPISGNNGYANGYDIQIAKRIAEELGLELEVVKLEWEGLPPAVQNGYADAIIAGMSATEKRREKMDFSDNYYSSDLVVIVSKDSPYIGAESLEDLAGAEITGQLNTFHYDVIDQIPDVVKLQAMQDFPSMRVALESGTIDGYVSERPEGIAAKAANPNFDYIEFEQGKGFDFTQDEVSIAVGIKKGNTALVNAVNEALATISEEEREQIMEDAINWHSTEAAE